MPKEKSVVQPSIEVSPCWTLREAAAYLKVPTYSIRQLVRRGAIPHQKIGKKFLVPVSEVKAFLAANWKRGVAA
jgi:excisionase family DNA binding protein